MILPGSGTPRSVGGLDRLHHAADQPRPGAGRGVGLGIHQIPHHRDEPDIDAGGRPTQPDRPLIDQRSDLALPANTVRFSVTGSGHTRLLELLGSATAVDVSSPNVTPGR